MEDNWKNAIELKLKNLEERIKTLEGSRDKANKSFNDSIKAVDSLKERIPRVHRDIV